MHTYARKHILAHIPFPFFKIMFTQCFPSISFLEWELASKNNYGQFSEHWKGECLFQKSWHSFTYKITAQDICFPSVGCILTAQLRSWSYFLFLSHMANALIFIMLSNCTALDWGSMQWPCVSMLYLAPKLVHMGYWTRTLLASPKTLSQVVQSQEVCIMYLGWISLFELTCLYIILRFMKAGIVHKKQPEYFPLLIWF